MPVTPTPTPIGTSVNTLTLAAGTTGGVAIASTIDPAVDYLLIYTNSAGATQGINRNTLLGITGSPVGTSDTQVLTNKTVGTTNAVTQLDGSFTLKNTSDPTKIAVFSLAGITTGTTRTYTLPNATDTLVGLAATQTLTNKTLTSPTINSPTISNATITADTLSGYTSANNGTFYGIGITGSVITTAGSVGAGANATNGVQAAALATNAITLGYAQITTSFTTTSTAFVQVTGLTATVTVPAGGRRIKITAYTFLLNNTASSNAANLSIWDGAVVSGTQLAQATIAPQAANEGGSVTCMAIVTPAAGSKTYNVGASITTSGTVSVGAATAAPAFILVEAI